MLMDIIGKFDGDNRFLSNFWPAPIRWCGTEYPTSEHLYQARKTADLGVRREIAAAPTAREAKALGQKAPLIAQWDSVKLQVMAEVLELKFQFAPLALRLAHTGNAILIEGNSWHDQIWGVCYCPQHVDTPGQNALGILLMRLRLQLPTMQFHDGPIPSS